MIKKQFNEGDKYFFYMMNHGIKKPCLVNGTLLKCEECGNPTAINCPWIVGGATSTMLTEASQFYKSYGDIDETIGDCEGNSFCEDCYYISDKVVNDD